QDHRIRTGKAKRRGVAAILFVQFVMRVLDRADAFSRAYKVFDELSDRRGLASTRLARERDDLHAAARAPAVNCSTSAVQSSSSGSRTLLRMRCSNSSSQSSATS